MFELEPARRDELIETWARRIVDRGLGTAAVFLLEAHKPIAGLSAHAAIVFQPLLSAVVPLNVGELAAFMHDVDNIERLLRRIEDLEQARHEADTAARTRRGELRRRARRIHRLKTRRVTFRHPPE